jgi:hypothetical protein
MNEPKKKKPPTGKTEKRVNAMVRAFAKKFGKAPTAEQTAHLARVAGVQINGTLDVPKRFLKRLADAGIKLFVRRNPGAPPCRWDEKRIQGYTRTVGDYCRKWIPSSEKLTQRYVRAEARAKAKPMTSATPKKSKAELQAIAARDLAARQTRRNPSGDFEKLAELHEQFLGRPPEGLVKIQRAAWTPENVYSLGPLPFVELSDGRRLELSDALLTADTNDRLHIANARVKVDSGGVTLSELPAHYSREIVERGVPGAAQFIGYVKRVGYLARKDQFDPEKKFLWVHRMGEEGGRLPALITHGGFLDFVGGDYTIEERGIVN